MLWCVLAFSGALGADGNGSIPSFWRITGCTNARDCRKEKHPAMKKDRPRAAGICEVTAQLIVGRTMDNTRVVEGAIMDTPDSPPFCADETHC